MHHLTYMQDLLTQKQLIAHSERKVTNICPRAQYHWMILAWMLSGPLQLMKVNSFPTTVGWHLTTVCWYFRQNMDFSTLQEQIHVPRLEHESLLFTQLYVICVRLGDFLWHGYMVFCRIKPTKPIRNCLLPLRIDAANLVFDVDQLRLLLTWAINVLKSSFGPQITIHGCVYHLTQSKWRKIQSLDLV